MDEPPIVEETDHAGPFDRLTRSAALALMVIAVLLYFVLQYASNSATARVASICAAMVMTAIWMRWDLRKHLWFWTSILILGLLHLPLVIIPHWTDKSYPGIVLLPAALLDLAIVYSSIKLAEKMMKRT